MSYKQIKVGGQSNELAGWLPGKESTFPSGAVAVALSCCPAKDRQTQRARPGLVTSTNFTAPRLAYYC